MEPDQLLSLGLIAGGLLAGGLALRLSLRHRKSPAERERERCLRINAIGRICDGTILEVTDLEQSGRSLRILHYRYSVSGVTYSAAQDVSALLHMVGTETSSEGVPASVKYDPQNPLNSIVVCELWTGLP